MAGLSSKMKKRRGEYEERSRQLSANIQKEKLEINRAKAIERIVIATERAKAEKKPAPRPTYYPKNPNYQRGYRIPAIPGTSARTGQKEGYVSIGSIQRTSIADIQSQIAQRQARLEKDQAELKARPSWNQYLAQQDLSKWSTRGTQRSSNLIKARAKEKQDKENKALAESFGVSTSGMANFGSTTPVAQAVRSTEKKQRLDAEPVFTIGSGKKVSVKRDGEIIKLDSDEGQFIQDKYVEQEATREINKEQQKLFNQIKNAKDWKEAEKIRDKALALNPNIGTFQQYFGKDGGLKKTKGILGIGDGRVVKTDSTGKPVSVFDPVRFFDGDKKVVTIKETSYGDEFAINKTPSKVETQIIKSGTDFFGSSGSGESRKSDTDYMTDDEKTFKWFFDVPKGDDPLSKFGGGVVKGTSNVMAGLVNIPLFLGSGLQQAVGGKPIDDKEFARFYSTPVTNVETAFFDSFIGEIKTGGKYDSSQRIQTGLDEAWDNFLKKPYSSAGSLVELGPYLVGSGIKAGVRGGTDLISGFFKTSPKKVGVQGKTQPNIFDDIFKFDTAKPSGFLAQRVNLGSGAVSRDGSWANFLRATDTKPKPPVFKTKGGGTFREYKATDFFKPKGSGKGPQQLLQIQKPKVKTKTKQLTKQKSMLDNFLQTKPKIKTKQKLKTKQVQKVKFQPGQFFKFSTKQKQKQKQTSQFFKPTTAKQKTKSKAKQSGFLKTTASTKSSGKGPRLGVIPFGWYQGGGKKGSPTKRTKKGKKGYTAWNVDPDTVGGFYDGPAFIQGRTQRVFKEMDKKRKKQKKAYDNWVDNFF